MANIAIYAEQQQKIITGVGILPTVPSPPTLQPSDNGWVDATDILEGQFAINITDGVWYYRANDTIIPLPGAINGVFARYADIASMVADQGNQLDKNILFVLDASADTNIKAGYAYYEYKGTVVGDISDYRLISAENGLVDNVVTLTDGAIIAANFNSKERSFFTLDTVETAIEIQVSNAIENAIGDFTVIKTNAAITAITFSGTGYKFINQKVKSLPALTVNFNLDDSAGFYFEISLKATSKLDGGDRVILITYQ